MGAFTMGILRLLPFLMLLGGSALAQSPTYGVGRTPSAEEIRAWDISISPTGKELPPGRGTAKEGALVYLQKPLAIGASTADPLAVRDDGMGLHQSRHASQCRGDANR